MGGGTSLRTLASFLTSTAFATTVLWSFWINPGSASPTTCSPGGAGVFPRDGNATAPVEEGIAWDSIVPSATLQWHACHAGKLQCARLEVPLNYSEPDGPKAAIALVRKRASVPEGSPEYRGPVLFNPGGPGTGGANLVLATGDMMAAILGPQFDIVGFDPRGIGASTPRATFFESEVERALYLAGQTRVIRPGGSTQADLASMWAGYQILGGLAARVDDDAGGFLKHLNTEDTATDMLSIVKAHGRDKLMYWGFSYGTVLGATFAAMYPDNVERMVFDAVMEPEDYYATTWLTNIADIDKTLGVFHATCAQAGPARCALSAPESTPADIKRALTAVFDRLLEAPVPAWTEDGEGDHGVVLDYALVRSVFVSALYAPYAQWAPLAAALKGLGEGDGAAFLALLGPTVVPKCTTCNDPGEGDFKEVLEGYHAIHCNDGDEVSVSLQALQEHHEALLAVSEWGDAWVNPWASCIGWPKMEKRFRGPFVGNTSHPILLIGSTADPVTPLSSAHKVAEGFPGSVVLALDAAGHTSLAAPSVCTQAYVQAYFLNGTLPEPGTVCDVIVKNPFEFGGAAGQAADGMDPSVATRALGDEDDRSSLLRVVSELAAKHATMVGLKRR